MRLLIIVMFFNFPCYLFGDEKILDEAIISVSNFLCDDSNVIENKNDYAYTFACHRSDEGFFLFSIQKRIHVCDARRLSEQDCEKDLSKVSQMPSSRLSEFVEDISTSDNVYFGKWRNGDLEFSSKGFDNGSLIYSLVTACKLPEGCNLNKNKSNSDFLMRISKIFKEENLRLKDAEKIK